MKSEKKRIQAAGASAFLLCLIFSAIHPQTAVFSGADRLAYAVFYMLVSVLICLAVLFPGKGWSDKKKRTGAVLLFCFMPAVNFVMFEIVSGNIRTILESGTGIVAMNLFLWYLLYMIAFSVTNRIRTSILVMNTLSYLLAVANAFVVSFRAQPIMLMDLKSLRTAATVASEFTYTLTPEMVLMGLLMLCCNFYAWKVNGRLRLRSVRMVLALASFCCVWSAYSGEVVKAAVGKAGAGELDFFIFNETYKKNGYLLSTLQSIWSLTIEKPDGYSAKKVREVANSLEKKPALENEPPENVIVIMNESYSDLSVLGDISTSEEITPFTSHLTENTVKGNLYVSVNGGGTANSEFEFLTGNTIAFLPAGVVAYQMYVEEGDSSIVSVFHDNGYQTIAFHPFSKENYNRPRVYEAYGFDSYIGLDDREYDNIRRFASDYSDYETLIDLYEEKEEGEKLFIFNVTIQNHAGYDDEDYESTVFLTDYPGKFPEAEQYLSLMQESDRAFEMLVDYFSGVEERTAILLFGDHQPFLGTAFYEAVMGEGETPISNITEFQKKFVTPYVLWTNYDLGAQQEENISTNFLGSYLLETLGFELPAYHQFLWDMQQNELPVVNFCGYLDKSRQMHSFAEEDEHQSTLEEYWMLEYNNLFDHRNKVAGIFE